jgi:hypothetical protein
MTVYELHINLVTCWRLASSGLQWRCYSSVLRELRYPVTSHGVTESKEFEFTFPFDGETQS